MTDAETLYFVLVSFYLAEGMFWARAGTFVFASPLGGRWVWRVDLRWALLRNPWGGVVVGNLLPSGQASLCQQWPVSLSPHGVYGYVAQAWCRDGRPLQPERFIRYEDMRSVVARGTDLLVNGVHFARLSAASLTRRLAATLRQLRSLPEAERGPVIAAALQHHLDVARVQERLRLFRALSADLQITCCLLFFVVFVLPPLLIYLNAYFSLEAFLGCYLALALLGVMQFNRAHRLLYPEERGERWKQSLLLLLSPADAVHGRDKLAHNLLGDFSPLAVARVLSSSAVFQEFASAIYRDLAYPLLPVCPSPDAGPRETEAWFRQQWQARIQQFLKDAGLLVDTLLLPPAPEDPSSRSYCPRCLGQYVLTAGTCADCGGRRLCPWSETLV